MTASLLTEVCRILTEVCNVKMEPELQPLTGETLTFRSANTEDNLRIDIRAMAFLGRQPPGRIFQCKGVQPSCAQQPTNDPKCLLLDTREGKRRAYKQQVCEVEHGSFALLIFSATGGVGPTAVVVFKRLAGMIAEKSNQQYSTTVGMIRCRISFLLLRSAIMCLRG